MKNPDFENVINDLRIGIQGLNISEENNIVLGSFIGNFGAVLKHVVATGNYGSLNDLKFPISELLPAREKIPLKTQITASFDIKPPKLSSSIPNEASFTCPNCKTKLKVTTEIKSSSVSPIGTSFGINEFNNLKDDKNKPRGQGGLLGSLFNDE